MPFLHVLKETSTPTHAVQSHNSPSAAQTVTDSEGALGSLNRLDPTQLVILQNIQALPYPEGAHVVP